MSELLTAAQMRAIEQAAIESGETTGLELMERAGRGVVKAIFEEWPDLRLTSHRAVVLCGPGNNGGDGFVVARLLQIRGWEVEVFLYGDPEKLPSDAKANWERWTKRNNVVALTNRNFRKEHPAYGSAFADLYVDALFGTGLTRRPEGDLEKVLRYLGGSGGDDYASRMVAIDAPSGLCLDSGRSLMARSEEDWAGHHASLTVTFHRPKLGHYLAGGPTLCGNLVLKDIGLKSRPRPPGETVWRAKPNASNLVKSAHTHKYNHGHALVLSGPPGHTGAARLAARGALRIGAGLVTVAAPPDAMAENAAQLTAIMLRPVADAGALSQTLKDARLNALCLGPGLGVNEETRALVSAALTPATAPRPVAAEAGKSGGTPGRRAVVLDADALTVFAGDPEALFAQLHAGCVLTPHAGEFSGLFPDIAERLASPATRGPAYSKLDAARDAAQRAGCAVLFKGPDTVIAAPSGAARINSAHYDRATPWLATAGSGDVLAGFITGLLARGFGPMDAASTAAWLHVECALSFGPGLIAEDLPEELPKVFRALKL